MTPATRVRPRRLGERSVVVRLHDVHGVHRLHDAVAPAVWAASALAGAVPGLLEAVPGGTTVMLRFRDRRSADLALDSLADLEVRGEATVGQRLHSLDVVYDGEDLQDCARLVGISAESLIRVHSSQDWTCAFLGFAPGFAYLRAADEPLDVPRRSDPRTAVPPGAVAMAGPYSAIYPRSSPGGWQLIGRTSRRLWDASDEASPSLIGPGDRVRFRPVRALVHAAVPDETPEAPPRPPGVAGLRVDDPGLVTVVTDLGRPGWATWGVGRSGAMDRGAHRAANRIVGNDPEDATLELVAGAEVRLTALGESVIAVAGAHGDLDVTDESGRVRTVPALTPVLLPDGAQLRIGAPPAGVRTYLAVRGGIDVPALLGSRSTDTLGALGGRPLRPGATVGVRTPSPRRVVAAPESAPRYPSSGEAVTIPVTFGPDDDLFDADQRQALLDGEWTVTVRSDRVGMRLAGVGIRRSDPSHEIESQALIRGAIQIPAHGQPIIFQADHPVTGGYPVIAVVSETALDTLAQAPPGSRLQFTAAS